MSDSRETDLVVRGRRVVTPAGMRPARVRVSGGVIRSVEAIDVGAPGEAIGAGGPGVGGTAPEERDDDRGPPAGARPGSDGPGRPARRVDAGDSVVMPGVVDSHVHVNEPGRTDWEGFRSATDAAACGGVTTLVDMPLNCSPVTTRVAALEEKVARVAGRCRVDCGFWGGAVPGNAGELAALAGAGVLGFKCFLCPSGIEEFPHLGKEDLREALTAVSDLGLPLLVHAELPQHLGGPGGASTAPSAEAGGAATPEAGDPRAYATYLATRPPEAEVEAIALLLEGARETGARVHVVHLSAADGLGPIRRAREDGVAVTVETCPHYLTFVAEGVPEGATSYKCAPPIRGRRNREALWRALERGEIDLVASDHSPCPPEWKDSRGGDFLAAWGGVASLQLALSATWTAARERGHGPEALARWMCEEPARLAGLGDRKGRIAPGLDGDLVIWDPDTEWTVRGRDLHHRHPVTPYEGRTLSGRVDRTYVRGVEVYAEGRLADERPGRWVRGRAA